MKQMRVVLGFASAVTLMACSKGSPPSSEGGSRPSEPAAQATNDVDARSRECAELLERLEAINRTSREFGVATKADGGNLADLWHGFARFAQADAREPIKSHDAKTMALEIRLRESRGRGAPLFAALASAHERADTEATQKANAALKEVGTEWKQLEQELRDGCR